MRNTITLVLLATGCARPVAPSPVTHPSVTVDLAPPEVVPDQSPETKLKLGHYWSPRFNIGLVIDRTRDQAKVRFDGTREIVTLTPQYFWFRTEYHRAPNQKLLVVSHTGQITLHIEGSGDDGIFLHRDGDAVPL